MPPAVDDFLAIFRRGEKFQSFHFYDARPIPGFYLAQDGVRRTDSDDVPGSKRRCAARAPITCRFKNRDAAVFVARAFGLSVHAISASVSSLRVREGGVAGALPGTGASVTAEAGDSGTLAASNAISLAAEWPGRQPGGVGVVGLAVSISGLGLMTNSGCSIRNCSRAFRAFAR
jgi:hypothetical protein